MPRLRSGVLLATVLALAGCQGVIADPPAGLHPAAPGAPAEPKNAFASGVRRLSQAELDNTLRDLLGDTTQPAHRLLNEDEFAPYDNDYTLQSASGAYVTGMEQLAKDVADRAMADPATRATLVPCTPTGPGDTACFRRFIESFAPKAFRRPVTADEVNAYMTLQSFATEDNPYVQHDFYTAVGLVIRSILQDPEFLYRIERGTPTGHDGKLALDDYEIASRMSYFLWGSTPDDALLADAAAGRLTTPDGRRAAARRMLADPKAREQLHRFHAMWLGYRSIPQPPDMVAAFNMETTHLIDKIVFDDPQSYMHMFTSPETYVNDMLADHYGLPHPAGGEGWVPYGDTGRAGILSQGSVLAAFSKFTDTSPTQRGILIRTRLMCQTIPSPPPTVNSDNPPPAMDGSQCKWDRYAVHRSNPSCAACHDLMDPIGFGLERFDMSGAYRTHDDGHPECPIAGQGEIQGVGTFSGPKELGQLLISTGKLDACIVQQLYTFAIGRKPNAAETGELQTLTTDFRNDDHNLLDLITDYVASDAFATRTEEAP